MKQTEGEHFAYKGKIETAICEVDLDRYFKRAGPDFDR